MVATAEKKLLTADDVWNMGADAHVELVRGELREMAAAGGVHGLVGGRLAGHLAVYGHHGREGEVFTSETGFVIEKSPTTLLVPDLVYVKVEHLPDGVAPVTYFETPPDALLETLSPSQRFGELVEKVGLYLKFGVPLVWAAIPVDKTFVAFYAGGQIRVFRSGDVLDGGDVLPGFRVPVDDLFR
ncbi:MAG TPA: Uma2 family endonuclease [Thermomicrobiales bacterium]|jgi:Uma2 family endonuclease